MLQNIECSGSVGHDGCGRIPTCAKKLGCWVLCGLTTAIVEPNSVDAIGVNDDEMITKIGRAHV